MLTLTIYCWDNREWSKLNILWAGCYYNIQLSANSFQDLIFVCVCVCAEYIFASLKVSCSSFFFGMWYLIEKFESSSKRKSSPEKNSSHFRFFFSKFLSESANEIPQSRVSIYVLHTGWRRGGGGWSKAFPSHWVNSTPNELARIPRASKEGDKSPQSATAQNKGLVDR